MRKKIMFISIGILIIVFVIIEGNFLGESMPENRRIVSTMLSCTWPTDTNVIETINDLPPECHHAIDRIEKPSDQKIIVYNQARGITLNFDRIESNHQKVWTCTGSPSMLFPKQCR